MESKKCRKCNEVKNVSFFCKSGLDPHGNQYYRPECKECRKPIIKEEAKQYRVKHKDELEVKAGEKILCECGMHIRRDWLTRHKKSACHEDLLKQKESLNRELTNDEVDTFLRKKYPYRFTRPFAHA